MKAMILAAGLGTRLRPLTNSRPKALIEINGVPLLEMVLKRLIDAGVTEVIINLHHFPEQITDFLNEKDNFGIRIEFSYEEMLLDTGGGLKQASWFFDDDRPFLLHNVDVVSNVDFKKMIDAHSAAKCLATLAVNRRDTKRYLIFDATNQLCGWKSLIENQKNLAKAPQGDTLDLAFCGIHVLSPAIFARLDKQGPFSIIESYLRLARENESILAFRIDDYFWQDMGKLQPVGSKQ